MNYSKLKKIFANSLPIFIGLIIASFLLDTIYMFIKSGNISTALSYWTSEIIQPKKFISYFFIAIGVGAWKTFSSKKR